MTRLQQHWKAVLARFFPRWKAAAGWRCTNRGRRGQAHGHSDIDRRLIEILFVSEDDDALDMLLIHEISHAVASLKHGKTWQRRLALAFLPKHAQEVFSGDLIVPKGFKWALESKGGYSEIDLNSVFVGGSKELDGFLDQVTKDSERCGRKPMLGRAVVA